MHKKLKTCPIPHVQRQTGKLLQVCRGDRGKSDTTEIQVQPGPRHLILFAAHLLSHAARAAPHAAGMTTSIEAASATASVEVVIPVACGADLAARDNKCAEATTETRQTAKVCTCIGSHPIGMEKLGCVQ